MTCAGWHAPAVKHGCINMAAHMLVLNVRCHAMIARLMRDTWLGTPNH